MSNQWPRAKRSKRLGGLKPQIYLWTAVKIWHWNCFLGKLGIQGTGKFLITNKNTWELKPSQNSDSIMHISQNQLWYIMFWVSFFFLAIYRQACPLFHSSGWIVHIVQYFLYKFLFSTKAANVLLKLRSVSTCIPPKKNPAIKMDRMTWG